MLPLINAVQTAIDENKDLASLKSSNADLSFLNSMFVSGLPKLTSSQKAFEKGNQLIQRFNPTYPSTKHVIEKERIKEILGGDIYHTAKIKGCIKNRLKDFSDIEFVRLKTRCDKIRSPKCLLGVLAEIMYEERIAPLLEEEQVEELLSSWKELKDVIDKGVQIFDQEAAGQKIKLQEKRLFVIQTLYDLSSENNITPEKWNNIDKNKKEKLVQVICEGSINSCLQRRSAFEKALFKEDLDKEKLEELKKSIFQTVKEDLDCLK